MRGYSYNLILKTMSYHIMAELKSIPIMPAFTYIEINACSYKDKV